MSYVAYSIQTGFKTFVVEKFLWRNSFKFLPSVSFSLNKWIT